MRAAIAALLFAVPAAVAQPPEPAKPAGAVEGASAPAPFRLFVAFDQRYPDVLADPTTGPQGKRVKDPRNRTAMMHDLVTEAGLNPVVAVFTRETPDPEPAAGKLAKLLDPLIVKHKASNLAAFVAFLKLKAEYPQDDAAEAGDPTKLEREKLAAKVRTLGETAKTARVVMGLAPADSAATAAWGLKPADDLTVVLYHRMKVVKRWDFKAGELPDDAKLKEIADAADKEATPK